MERIFAAHDEGAGIFGSDDPLSGPRSAQAVMRSIECVEAPRSANRADYFSIHVGGLQRLRLDGKTSEQGIGLGGQIDAVARLGVDVEHEIVRQVGRKNQRSAFGGKQQRRLARAKYLRCVHGAQWRNWRRVNRRQTNHQDRLGIAKGRRIIEAQVEFVFFRQSQRGDVLILRGMRGAQNAGHVNHRAHVRTVVTAAGVGRGRDLCEQVGGRAGGESGNHGLAVGVVEH